ncbi:MAG: hypothetical protein IPJ40_04635 [Saprospirales bacterium]|nr:hypothetical protein [Saprospirales bacterium]
MSTPLLKDIENALQAGDPKKALENLQEWARSYLPDVENEVITTLSRLNKANRDRIHNDISEDLFQTEFAKILQVVQGILSTCRHSGVRPEEGQVLQIHHKHTCDRIPQNDRYQQLSLESPEKKARFFYLYGDEQQSHEGFFKRICYELEGRLFDYLNPELRTSCKVEMAEVTFDFSQDPNVYRINVLKAFFASLGVQSNEHEPLLQCNLLDVYQRSPIVQQLGPGDYVCVLIHIGQWDWDPQLTPETARWFIYQFSKTALPANGPRFLFFMGVEFDGTDDTVRKQVEAAVEEGKDLLALPELDMVQFNDVGRWLSKYKLLAPTAAEQRQLLQQHFQR